ncbi:hypothetical protein GGS24DRAFT_503732 [Hypoxylon argillaceum]|nr:hypothetical protein GGS24DRAFT_503732 [Hypoxylon argillaceum]
MASNHLDKSQRPSRPKTPKDYIPTPNHTVVHTDAFRHLLNEEQRGTGAVRVHAMPRDQFVSFNQLAPQSPLTTKSTGFSWKSKTSALDAACRGISRSLTQGIEKTKPVLKTAVTSSKAAFGAVGRSNRPATSAGPSETEKEGVSRSSSSSSAKSLFHRRRLPRLQLPELTVAVGEALNSACSTDTEKSASFGILGLSPTSRELKFQWERDHHSKDVAGEFHNMLSARRRVRKGKFGAEVIKYQLARPTWDESWNLRINNDNLDDRRLLRKLTNALQEQKDEATRIVQKNPGRYPGFEPVSTPGCTLKLYWQNKSSYR